MINKPKGILEPTQYLKFLMFSVNLVHQELSLPAGNVKKVRTKMRHLLEGNQLTARKLSQLLGRLQVATKAVPLAPPDLFYTANCNGHCRECQISWIRTTLSNESSHLLHRRARLSVVPRLSILDFVSQRFFSKAARQNLEQRAWVRG